MKRYRDEVIRRGGSNNSNTKVKDRFTPVAKSRLKKVRKNFGGKSRKALGNAIANNLQDKNSTTNTTVNTAIATKNTIKRVHNSVKNIKKTIKMIKTTIKLIAAMIKAPIILKVSLILAALLLIIVLVGGIVLAFVSLTNVQANEDTVLAYKREVERLDTQFLQEVNKLKATPGYDEYVVTYMNEDGIFKTDWKSILVYMSVKYEQKLTFSEDEQKSIAELYNKLHHIETKPATNELQTNSNLVTSPPENTNTEKPKESAKKKLVIEVYSNSVDEIIANSGFTSDQIEWYTALMESNLADFFSDNGYDDVNALSNEEMKNLIENAQRTSTSRQELIDVALTLVGRVKYFWGGKSNAGWNSDWGKLKQIDAEGSNATGTMQPYGLDCSGYVDWVYKTSGIDNILSGGTTYQWQNSYPITDSELLPGDLVFKNPPGSSGINHIGLFYCRNADGIKQYIHCTSPDGVVINSYDGFKYWRRPYVKFTDE